MKVDFFIVGAPKAGTTSLYHYLNEHPKIIMSKEKEPDYFSHEALKNQNIYYYNMQIDTEEKYHSLFNVERDDSILGEASVSYLFYEDVPAKIKQYNKHAKIIIVLRNPIERAYSHYLMDFRLGLVQNTFEEIIYRGSSVSKDFELHYQQYIEVSQYFSQIERYLKIFGKENIHIIDYEDLQKDQEAVLKNIFLFLEVETDYQANIKKEYNTFSMSKYSIINWFYSFFLFRRIVKFILPKKILKIITTFFFQKNKKPILSFDTRFYLQNLFKKDIQQLGVILNKDFSKWIK